MRAVSVFAALALLCSSVDAKDSFEGLDCTGYMIDGDIVSLTRVSGEEIGVRLEQPSSVSMLRRERLSTIRTV